MQLRKQVSSFESSTTYAHTLRDIHRFDQAGLLTAAKHRRPNQMGTQRVWVKILDTQKMESENRHPQVTWGDCSTFGTSWVERGQEQRTQRASHRALRRVHVPTASDVHVRVSFCSLQRSTFQVDHKLRSETTHTVIRQCAPKPS